MLALVGDSTNAVRDGRSPSERDVAKTLTDLIRTAPARVAVTTFASHVGRIRAVARRRARRTIARSWWSAAPWSASPRSRARPAISTASQDFRSIDAYGYLPPDKVVALCTGSQGEPRAALARIAEDEHPEVTLGKGDRVIFSSRAIPGNEKAVDRVINGLIEQGIEVITDRTHLVHVSGHPRRAELADMIRWIRPQILIPVHGEALHLSEHAELARRRASRTSSSAATATWCGSRPVPPASSTRCRPGRLYKDGALLVSAEAKTVADRRRLSFAGVVSVALAVTDKGELAADPEVELIGIPETDADGESHGGDRLRCRRARRSKSLPKPRRRDPDSVAEAVRRAVRAAIARRWNKKPICHVHVLTV